MDQTTTTRRRFLVAAVALTGTAGGLRTARVWAQQAILDADARRTLAAAARRLYPHPALADAVYADILDGALNAAAAATLANPVAADAVALEAALPANFLDLEAQAQTAALGSLERTSYFAGMRETVRLSLYNHPALWELVGYGGPSWQQGGYLNRGAGEIDWLPETD